MYLFSVMTAFALGGLFALLIRTELLTPGRTIVDHDTYNQLFTLHGAVMVFLVIIPGIPAALGNIALPLQLGAKDVAFPRLNLFSYHLWLLGALFFMTSLVMSAADTGWTFYTPYSTRLKRRSFRPRSARSSGLQLDFHRLNFLVTIHKLRPRGYLVPAAAVHLGALYATALIQCWPRRDRHHAADADRRASVRPGHLRPGARRRSVLSSTSSGSLAPCVYIRSCGLRRDQRADSGFLAQEDLATSSRALSSVAIAILGLLGGATTCSRAASRCSRARSSRDHLFDRDSHRHQDLQWISTMYKPRSSARDALRAGVPLGVPIGGVTGIFLAVMSTDIHLHVPTCGGAFHYVMMGGRDHRLLGGLHYGGEGVRPYVRRKWVRIGAVLVFIGLNVTFCPQFTWHPRMPRRYYNTSRSFRRCTSCQQSARTSWAPASCSLR